MVYSWINKPYLKNVADKYTIFIYLFILLDYYCNLCNLKFNGVTFWREDKNLKSKFSWNLKATKDNQIDSNYMCMSRKQIVASYVFKINLLPLLTTSSKGTLKTHKI